MSPHRALNWTLAALIALVMSTAYLLDGQPTELDAIEATADSVQDAQQAATQSRTAQVQP